MQMLFALFGGLAMFLYGMDRMSRALQRAAGDAMKRLLARLTATPLLGILTGLAVTAVLQSSSAATVAGSSAMTTSSITRRLESEV